MICCHLQRTTIFSWWSQDSGSLSVWPPPFPEEEATKCMAHFFQMLVYNAQRARMVFVMTDFTDKHCCLTEMLFPGEMGNLSFPSQTVQACFRSQRWSIRNPSDSTCMTSDIECKRQNAALLWQMQQHVCPIRKSLHIKLRHSLFLKLPQIRVFASKQFFPGVTKEVKNLERRSRRVTSCSR